MKQYLHNDEHVEYILGSENTSPREKMEGNRASHLSDKELLSVILGSGTKGRSVHQISEELVALIDEKGYKIREEDLLSVHGLGKAKSLCIIALLELGRRLFIPRKRKITSPLDLLPLLAHYADRQQECFLTYTLNGANEIISSYVVSVGLLNRALVHPREVFRQAVIDQAASIIIAHNHPSGNMTPSSEDIAVTEGIVNAGKIFEIAVLDHIIFSTDAHYSFLGHGLL